MLWLMSLPQHLFWSHSIYNVIVPFLFLVLSLRFAKAERWLGLSVAMAMAVACRLETIFFWGWLLYYIPFWNWRVLLKSILGTVITLGLLSSMTIPGEGEYIESIAYNWWFVSYYWLYIIPLVLALLLARGPQLLLMGWSLLWMVGHHFVLSTFNDFSSRHILALGIITFEIWKEIFATNHGVIRYALFFAIFCNGYVLWDDWGRIHQSDTLFLQEILEWQATLPQSASLSVEQAQNRGCAWIVEMEPFASHPLQPIRSHFNLLNQTEVDALLWEYGCIDWCYTIQDWGWTELGVQDRALRLEQMYEWDKVALVRENGSNCELRTMNTSQTQTEHIH